MIRKYVCVLTIILFTQNLVAQNEKLIDSLKTELLRANEASEKFYLYRAMYGEYYNSAPEKSKSMLDSMSVYMSNEALIEKGIFALSKGSFETRMSRLEEGAKFTQEAIEHFTKSNTSDELAIALGNFSMIKRRKGEYKLAIEYLLKSLHLQDSIKAPLPKQAFGYHTLGTIYGDLKDYPESSKYFKKAKEIYVADQNEEYAQYMDLNLATNEVALGNYDEAEEKFLNSIEYFKGIKNFFTETTTYLELGQLFLKKGDLDRAAFYLEEVLNRESKLNHKEVMAVTRSRYGEVLYRKEMYQKALPYILQSAESNKTSGALKSVASDYGRLAKVYANLNDYEKAYSYSERGYQIEDSLTGIKNLEVVNALKIKYETEKKEADLVLKDQEIQLLEKSVKVKKLTITIYGIGMFALLAIAGLLYFGFRQKIKKDQIENEKQREIFQNELAFKKKELTSQTLHLVKKNTFLQELKENLEGLKNSPDSFKSEFRRIMLLLKKETAEDKDWEVFKSYFSQVHNDFDHKIKSKASDISEKEIRLASFLRMNLSTKEIASMFNVLPDSVLTSKYRLKKKLSLTKEDDLTQFLSEI